MRKKQQTITFRVTDDEYKMIKEKATNFNLTVTDFIVKCCQEKEMENQKNNKKVQQKFNF